MRGGDKLFPSFSNLDIPYHTKQLLLHYLDTLEMAFCTPFFDSDPLCAAAAATATRQDLGPGARRIASDSGAIAKREFTLGQRKTRYMFSLISIAVNMQFPSLSQTGFIFCTPRVALLNKSVSFTDPYPVIQTAFKNAIRQCPLELRNIYCCYP